MNPQGLPLLSVVFPEVWNEELARAKKFKEAVQRRATEKKLWDEGQKLKKPLTAEPLVIEM